MLCQHLYSSLFQSSLPLPALGNSDLADSEKLRHWAKGLTHHLDSYMTLYAQRLAEKSDFVTLLNGKLAKLELYDRKELETQYAEMQLAYAAADKAALERRERGVEKEILLDNADIRSFLAEDAQDIVTACPTLAEKENVEAEVMFASCYTVFEALLIHHDDDTLFNYVMNSQQVFDFFMSPVFPVTPEDIEQRLVLKNIVDYKTYMACYAEMIDILFTKFSGKEYIFSNVSALVEYFLDVIGYSYAHSYRDFLAGMDCERIASIQNFERIFEFHFFNYMANVEHMRCTVHAFLNKDTMRMLAAMVGQFSVLQRHGKRQQDMGSRQQEFANLIEELWQKNSSIGDHTAMISFLESSKLKKVRDLCKLFGKAKTKNVVLGVLQRHGAVRGLTGYKKRVSK